MLSVHSKKRHCYYYYVHTGGPYGKIFEPQFGLWMYEKIRSEHFPVLTELIDQ